MTASGKGLYHTRVGKATSFIIHTLGRASKEFDVIVSGPPDVIPPNEAVPVRCYQQKDGNLLAEFVTRTAGAFKIDVLENMRPIVGSPFQCLSYDPGIMINIHLNSGHSDVEWSRDLDYVEKVQPPDTMVRYLSQGLKTGQKMFKEAINRSIV